MKKAWIATVAAAIVTVTLCASCATSKDTSVTAFHLGSWEDETGYSQSVRLGNRIIVSGTTGDTQLKSLDGQLRDAYKTIELTLKHDGASLKNVIKETIYCRDMDGLIKLEKIRKEIYGSNAPAATWVQVQRLYSPEHLVEIEVEAVVP